MKSKKRNKRKFIKNFTIKKFNKKKVYKKKINKKIKRNKFSKKIKRCKFSKKTIKYKRFSGGGGPHYNDAKTMVNNMMNNMMNVEMNEVNAVVEADLCDDELRIQLMKAKIIVTTRKDEALAVNEAMNEANNLMVLMETAKIKIEYLIENSSDNQLMHEEMKDNWATTREIIVQVEESVHKLLSKLISECKQRIIMVVAEEMMRNTNNIEIKRWRQPLVEVAEKTIYKLDKLRAFLIANRMSRNAAAELAQAKEMYAELAAHSEKNVVNQTEWETAQNVVIVATETANRLQQAAQRMAETSGMTNAGDLVDRQVNQEWKLAKRTAIKAGSAAEKGVEYGAMVVEKTAAMAEVLKNKAAAVVGWVDAVGLLELTSLDDLIATVHKAEEASRIYIVATEQAIQTVDIVYSIIDNRLNL